MNSLELNTLLMRGRIAAQSRADTLEARVAATLADLLVSAAGRFEQAALPVHASVTASQDVWLPPAANEVYPAGEAAERLAAAGVGSDDLFWIVMSHAAPEADGETPIVAHLLAGMDAHLGDIVQTEQQEIGRVIQEGYVNGDSLAVTSAGIAGRGLTASITRPDDEPQADQPHPFEDSGDGTCEVCGMEESDDIHQPVTAALSAGAHAAMIMRTELARAAGAASLAAMKIGGQQFKQWNISPGAAHPRHELLEGLDQQVVGVDETFDVAGYPALYPADPQLPPGEACNCRCYLTAPGGPITAAGTGTLAATTNGGGAGMTVIEEPTTAAASGSTSLSLGARDETWDANAAQTAMSPDQYASAHFYKEDGADAKQRSSYKLPFASPSPSLHAVWGGVTAAAARLGQTQMPSGDVSAVKSRIAGYYSKAAKKYGDDSITPPWEGSAAETEPSAEFASEMAAHGMVWVRGEGWLQVEDELAAMARKMRGVTAAVDTASGGWAADPLFFLDEMSRDGRILASKSAEAEGPTWTPTPKTLMGQSINPESGGHALAEVCGTMPGEDIRLSGTKVLASGRFNDDEVGQKFRGYVENRSLTGISVDLAPQKWEIEVAVPDDEGPGLFFFTSEGEEPVDGPDTITIPETIEDVVLRFTEYEIIGATLVPTPAFGDAQVGLTASGQPVYWPGHGGMTVECRRSEGGWPVPVRLTVGGHVRPDGGSPRPHGLAEAVGRFELDELQRLASALSMLSKIQVELASGHVAGVFSVQELRGLFVAALQSR